VPIAGGSDGSDGPSWRGGSHDGVTGVVGNAAGLRQDFKKSDGPVGLVNHGMSHSPNNGDGFAFPLFNTEAYFGMGNQAVGFQDFRNFFVRPGLPSIRRRASEPERGGCRWSRSG